MDPDVVVKCYKTDWEDDKDPAKRCCFAMLTKLINDDIKNHPGLRPRIMHINDRSFHGSMRAVAIVIWE